MKEIAEQYGFIFEKVCGACGGGHIYRKGTMKLTLKTGKFDLVVNNHLLKGREIDLKDTLEKYQ